MVKYALITGASSGFGEAISEALAKKGFGLILFARRLERLEALREKLLPVTPHVHIVSVDVQSSEAVTNGMNSLDEDVKSNIDVLVNNAGLAAGRTSIEEGLVLDWEQMIDTNLKGLLYISRAVIPFMKKRGGGLIINITSIAGKEAYPQGNVYCATKAAVDHLTKGMRLDLLPFGIKVSSIAPGAAETEFSLVRFKGNEAMAASVYEGFTPLNAQDIAETVVFIVERPAHVSIHDVVLMPAAQASATTIRKTLR
jgi:NADP-dependent 3-hydroxy acid dehydrogenase YdfG